MQIIEEATTWPGVEARPGDRGEFAFKVGGREIGHLHGEQAACGVQRNSSVTLVAGALAVAAGSALVGGTQ